MSDNEEMQDEEPGSRRRKLRRQERRMAIVKSVLKRGRDEGEERRETVERKLATRRLTEEDLFQQTFDPYANGPLKYCNIFITVTLNKTPGSVAEYFKDALGNGNRDKGFNRFKEYFQKALYGFITNKENWIPKVNLSNGRVHQFTDEDALETIRATMSTGTRGENPVTINDDDFVWEVGERFHRVHLHVLARLSYTRHFKGYFHVDRDRLHDAIRGADLFQDFPWNDSKLPYINFRYIKSTTDSVKAYMQKLHTTDEFRTLSEITLDRINEYHQKLVDRNTERFNKSLERDERIRVVLGGENNNNNNA